jgi:hypothetical protein
MRAKIYLSLSEAEQLALEDTVRNSSSHRIRQRSQALLWSHAGKDRNTIAELYGTKPDTISACGAARAVQEMGIREVIKIIRFTPKRSSCQTQ